MGLFPLIVVKKRSDTLQRLQPFSLGRVFAVPSLSSALHLDGKGTVVIGARQIHPYQLGTIQPFG